MPPNAKTDSEKAGSHLKARRCDGWLANQGEEETQYKLLRRISLKH